MASGEMSAGVAWMVVAGLAGLGVGIVATNFGQLITALYTFGLVLGTIYRWVAFRFCTSPGKKAGASVLGHTDGICRAWAVIIRTLTRSIAQGDDPCLTSLPAPVRPCSPDDQRAATAAQAVCCACLHDHCHRPRIPAQLWRVPCHASRHRAALPLEPRHHVHHSVRHHVCGGHCHHQGSARRGGRQEVWHRDLCDAARREESVACRYAPATPSRPLP